MTVYLVLSGTTHLRAGEADDPRVSSGSLQPKVSVTPRARPVKEAALQTALDRMGVIRVDTMLVLIPVAVTDPIGRIVTGLEKDHFKLTEDKIEQEITSFSSVDVPLSVGIVFDTSGSMGGKMRQAGQAVAQFMNTANPEDEFFLVQFNDRPELTVPFTHSAGELLRRLSFVQSKGRTALFDGVYLAIHEMKRARNGRRALLIISDGGDNGSRYSEGEVRKLVREADVQVYAIGIFEPMGGHRATPEELSGPGLLGDITEQSGGRHFPVENLADLPDVAAKIGLELRNQYVLTYAPRKAVRDGKYRRVQVQLVRTMGLPPLKATFRRGYYSLAQ